MARKVGATSHSTCELTLTTTHCLTTAAGNAYEAESKLIRLKWDGKCRECGAVLARNDRAWWRPGHLECCACRPALAQPGESALRIGERRGDKSWLIGGDGERRLGNFLNKLKCEDVRVLHDRGLPGSRANIDHLVITTRGVYVIDAKTYRDKVITRRSRSDHRVGKRNGARHVEGVLNQRDSVRALLPVEIPVFPVLCYVDARWLWWRMSFTVSGVRVCDPSKLKRRIEKRGSLATEQVGLVYDTLLTHLRVA